jgi:hypothetical protein
MADLLFYTNESQEGDVTRGPFPLDSTLYSEVLCMKFKKDPKNPKKTFKEIGDELYLARGGRFAPKPQVTRMERAYIMGFMSPDLAQLFHCLVNRSTDLVCVCSNMPYIPVTFEMGASIFSRDHPLYGSLKDSTKLLTQPLFGGENVPEEIGKLARVMLLDPRHGRPARRHLYPLTIRCLERANSVLK